MTTSTRRGSRIAAVRRRDEIEPTPWPLALLCGAGGGAAALFAFPPYDQIGRAHV